MTSVSRRRADRRRLIADWAARAQRFHQADAEPLPSGDYASGEAGPAPLRRLPFELLEPATAMVLVQPAPNGNGHGTEEAAEPPAAQPPAAEPPAAELRATEPLSEAAEPLAADPAVAAATVEIATLLQAAGTALEAFDPARARQLYREVLERDPEHVPARSGLALALDAGGEHLAALEQLDRCRAQDQGSLEILVHRCGVLGSLGRYAEAERELRAALEQEPENAAAHFHLGLVASRRGRWREAVPCFLRAAALAPNLAGVHFYLGEALNHVDDLAGALQAYQRAVELSPRHAKAWYGMGIVLDRMNRPDDAAQQYRRSRQLQGK